MIEPDGTPAADAEVTAAAPPPPPASVTSSRAAVSLESVEATIAALTEIDETGDKRTMNRMARRLGKEQPALLRRAGGLKDKHGDAVGEAAVFYSTLVWAIFDRHTERAPRLTGSNIEQAGKVLEEERAAVDGLADRPIHERIPPGLAGRQPHLCAKLSELLAEDVRTEAMTAECAEIIFPPTQTIVEAFDAAVDGRRPGERVGPIVRETAKVGRNDPCPCGSGKKYKKCHEGSALP
ncbi:MAG TPA: SEC-C metal-binding domain-containing protein [Kofleriaceae bacterium]|nr:SEC-C metal-binding domain-containing protein [Kofleriaceae bacterium]